MTKNRRSNPGEITDFVGVSEEIELTEFEQRISTVVHDDMQRFVGRRASAGY